MRHMLLGKKLEKWELLVIDERNPHPEENQTSTLDAETENLVKMMKR